jgi:hypothetical protein
VEEYFEPKDHVLCRLHAAIRWGQDMTRDSWNEPVCKYSSPCYTYKYACRVHFTPRVEDELSYDPDCHGYRCTMRNGACPSLRYGMLRIADNVICL